MRNLRTGIVVVVAIAMLTVGAYPWLSTPAYGGDGAEKGCCCHFRDGYLVGCVKNVCKEGCDDHGGTWAKSCQECKKMGYPVSPKFRMRTAE